MPQVVQANSFNQASLVVNDVYIVVIQPVSTSIQGVSTSICGLSGTASWGPLNTPQPVYNPQTLSQVFGPIKNAVNDMPTDGLILLRNNIPLIYGVRTSDGTDAAATAAQVSASSGTVTIGGTVHTGDAVLVNFNSNPLTYTVLNTDATLTAIATKIVTMLNNNAAFNLIANASSSGAVVTILSKNNDNTLTLVCSVSGGGATVTATASGATLAGGNTALGTWNALWTGGEGNNLRAYPTPVNGFDPAAPKFNVVVARLGVAPDSELYTNLPQTGFAAALAAALANGQSITRGPSNLARFTPGGGSGAPVQTTQTFAGGLNGDTSVLTDAQQMGSDLVNPATGMYGMRGYGIQHIGLSGNINSTSWSPLLTFAKSNGMLAFAAFPSGTSTPGAIAAKNAAGIQDPYMAMDKDFIQWNDTFNGVLRMLSPMAFIMGECASLAPNQSPGNKPINDILNTERTLAANPYSTGEIGLLTAAGIGFITNNNPGGNFFGRRHGLNTSNDNAVNGIEYTRMTNFLAYSLAGPTLGKFIDMLQTATTSDPTRSLAETALRSFFNGLKDPGARLITDFGLDMSFGTTGVNTPASVKAGFMIANVRVQYMSVIRFFVVRLLGGKSVEVTMTAA